MILDLFAGPGGWESGFPTRDSRVIGVEHDASACATRAAAGHLTIRQDVRTLDTARFRPLGGLIASPPCQTFSAAGNREGVADFGALVAHVHSCVTGWHAPPAFSDERTGLVLEPLRFALECVPAWIALEQVPDVLPVWEAYAYVLRALGWSVWCGILNAADFGVPQTRRRAILVAHRRKVVQPPEPTHCQGGAQTMFGELLPWVSMAEALGWGDVRLGFPRRDDRGDSEDGYRERDWRDADAPSFALTEKARSWTVRTGNNSMVTGRAGSRAGDGDVQPYERSMDDPAPTLDRKAGGAWTLQWWWTDPSTTLGGDPRVSPRCHHDEGMQGRDALAAAAAAAGEGSGVEPVKLTVRDALILQSFPPDYPVQGSKTKQFEQIGNAIPPRLARAVLAALPSEGEQR